MDKYETIIYGDEEGPEYETIIYGDEEGPEYGGDFVETHETDDAYVTIEYIRDGEKNVPVHETITYNNGNIVEKDYIENVTYYWDEKDGRYVNHRREYDDGTIVYFDDVTGKKIRQEKKDGTIIYYNEYGESYHRIENQDGSVEYQFLDENGKNYCIEHSDKSKEYITDDGNFIIYPDGTYKSGDEKGTYTIDESGYIICKDENGNQTFYNRYGQKYQEIDKSGIVHNLYNDSHIEVKNGKTSYSKHNHIEYDEEAYDKILTTLNEIDGTSIENKCSEIVDTVNSFPDKCSSSGIDGVKGNINNHVGLVKTLSEMTNYSLLAYQACDEELRDGLYLLVDSLFGENEHIFANNFKRIIESRVEDSDNDSVLEYKKNTNFRVIADNAIVSNIYTDSDGNKWYLNKNNTVIKVEGSNLKINYGGETFNLSYDENGIAKLTDSNGNNLDIFGEYNLESKQYGGNQEVLSFAGENPFVDAIIKQYFPDFNEEEKMAYLTDAKNTGCGNVGMANLVFKKFEGDEKGFYDTFGYPMYNVKYDPNSGMTVDYNYEPLIMDLFCHENSTEYNYWGSTSYNYESMEKYLEDTYKVSLTGYSKPLVLCGLAGYDIYEMDGTLLYPNGGGHAMVIVDKTNDGRLIVSSWGKKLIVEPHENSPKARTHETHYTEYK